MTDLPTPTPEMPIRASPFAHQRAAFEFVCTLFGLIEADDEKGSDAHCQKPLPDPEESPF